MHKFLQTFMKFKPPSQELCFCVLSASPKMHYTANTSCRTPKAFCTNHSGRLHCVCRWQWSSEHTRGNINDRQSLAIEWLSERCCTFDWVIVMTSSRLQKLTLTSETVNVFLNVLESVGAIYSCPMCRFELNIALETIRAICSAV